MDVVEDLLVQGLPDRACELECSQFFVLGKFIVQPEEAFLYLPGQIPVLLSAPHAVRHSRLGRLKPADTFTGPLALILHELTDCSVLVNRRNYGGDPNFDRLCPYKDKLQEILKHRQFKIVLDLHGAAELHGFDVDMGTLNGRSLGERPELLSCLSECLKNYGLDVLSLDRFPAAKQYTVTRFVYENTGIPALQLEISAKFRRPYKRPVEFCRLTAGLQEFIGRMAGFN